MIAACGHFQICPRRVRSLISPSTALGKPWSQFLCRCPNFVAPKRPLCTSGSLSLVLFSFLTPRSIDPPRRIMHLSGLFIHPVKSLRACAVTTAHVDALGLVGDRRFLV